jgi:hypothetical protein
MQIKYFLKKLGVKESCLKFRSSPSSYSKSYGIESTHIALNSVWLPPSQYQMSHLLIFQWKSNNQAKNWWQQVHIWGREYVNGWTNDSTYFFVTK